MRVCVRLCVLKRVTSHDMCVSLRRRGCVKRCGSIYQRRASRSEQHSARRLSGAAGERVQYEAMLKCCGNALKTGSSFRAGCEHTVVFAGAAFWPFLVFQRFSILNADKFKWTEQKQSRVSRGGNNKPV